MGELVTRDVTYLGKDKEISIFLSANPTFDLLKDFTISLLRPTEEVMLHY